jgi:fumarate reductase subunit D
MFNLPTNISKRDRMVRGILGALLIIAAMISPVLVMLIGILLIAEAAISYCGVVQLIEHFKLDADKPANKPPV